MKIWIGQALLEHLDSWSKLTLRPTAVESYYLSNFGFLNEEIDPKIGIYTKNWARQVLLENFDFLVKICAKVNFFGIGQFAQFQSFKWRNGSQNQNVLKKLSGTGPFWKFWLFGQSQSSTLSKLFLFFLFNFFFNRRFGPGQDEWVKPNRPRQTGQTVVGGDIIALEGTCSTCKRVAGWGDTWNWCYERQCHWRRVEACGSFFGLKFFWALSI